MRPSASARGIVCAHQVGRVGYCGHHSKDYLGIFKTRPSSFDQVISYRDLDPEQDLTDFRFIKVRPTDMVLFENFQQIA